LAVAAIVAGCGGSKPSLEDARPFADGFTHRLAVVGTWQSIEADVGPDVTREMRNLQTHIRKDGIRRVDGKGQLRHDCPPAPAVGAGKDCFVYRVSGSQVVPLGGVQRLNARLRLWVARESGRWQVINYDYAVIPGS
jgi:hypothetical protein